MIAVIIEYGEEDAHVEKKLSKMLVLTLMVTMIYMSSVNAADIGFSFKLGNTGSSYVRVSSSDNKKLYTSDPWTIKISTINTSGPYGISFCPYKSAAGVACTQSSAWIKTMGTQHINYYSGDVAKIRYKVAARQDNSYWNLFTASGKFNADRTE